MLVGLTVLVDEHAERNAVGVEAIEEILDVAADKGVEAKLLLVLDDSLGHGGNHVVVTVADLDQELQETENEIKTIPPINTLIMCAHISID